MQLPIDRIRRATQSLHDSLDVLPYAVEVTRGTVPIATYVRFLRAVFELHLALEEAVERAGDARLREVFGGAHVRRVRLERDLAALGAARHAVDGSILHALVLAQQVRLMGAREPAQLLGVAYVLEGSQLGGLVQHAALVERPELRHGGLSYLAGSGRGQRAEFGAFVQRLDRVLGGDEGAIESAIAGAVATFEGFIAIVRSLDDTEAHVRWLSGVLNGDAGTHAVPSDLREVVAALRAGETTYHQYAYYEARYGARGLRFTRSDSAWLAAIARDEPVHASRQLAWLATVLAARGMPRLLLEQHLDTLHARLCAVLPESADCYDVLRRAACTLREARLAALPEADARALGAAFCADLVPEAGLAPAEAASLLLAAIADEHHGISQAVASLQSWLASPTRFSTRWIEAVTRTLRAARAACAARAREAQRP